MFYDNYLRLCNQKGVSASGAALEMGLSRAAVTGWAQGKVPRDATLRRIADYFGVSVEELTRDQKEKPAEDDEPAADDTTTHNPDTGANDVVGVAVALAAVSLVAAGAVSLKK